MDNPAFVIDPIDSTGKNGSLKPQEPRKYTYEEAITLTRVGKFHYLLLLVCGCSFMGVMCDMMGVSLVLPVVRCEFKPTQMEQSFLTSAAFFGIVVSSHFMGFLADTWGRARTLSWALLISVGISIVSALSVNIWMLIVCRFLVGMVISCGQGCVFSYMGEFHGNKTRGRYVTLLAVFLPLAMIYLPAMATFILPIQIDAPYIGGTFSSWRILLLINPLVPALASTGFFLLPEAPKYLLIHGEEQKTLKILRKMFAMNTGRPEEEYPVTAIINEMGGANLSDVGGFKEVAKMIWSQTAPLFYRERVWQTLNICFALFVVYGISQGLFMWFPTVLVQLIETDGDGLLFCESLDIYDTKTAETSSNCSEVDNLIFLAMIGIGIFFTFLFLIFSYTIDYVGKKNLLYIWGGVTVICTILIHWMSNLYLAICVITAIMAVGNCGGVIGTLSMEFFPTHINAMGMSFIMMIGRLGAMFGSYVVGLVIFDNCDNVFWVLCGVIAVELGLFTLLPERKRPKKVKSPPAQVVVK